MFPAKKKRRSTAVEKSSEVEKGEGRKTRGKKKKKKKSAVDRGGVFVSSPRPFFFSFSSSFVCFHTHKKAEIILLHPLI